MNSYQGFEVWNKSIDFVPVKQFGHQHNTTRDKSWATQLIAQLNNTCTHCIDQQGKCSIMLTGGRSASQLYKAWSQYLYRTKQPTDIQFYFGDERCVSPDHAESNYRMVMTDLFPNEPPTGMSLHRMEAEAEDLYVASGAYSQQLPDKIDILLLSIGEDGHIASLFPQSTALYEHRKKVLSITGPKAPYQRLTITPKVIQSASHVFVMAIGEQKRAVYEKALQDPEDIDSLPARLVLNRNWIFGD